MDSAVENAVIRYAVDQPGHGEGRASIGLRKRARIHKLRATQDRLSLDSEVIWNTPRFSRLAGRGNAP
jgi:hypothetical protein